MPVPCFHNLILPIGFKLKGRMNATCLLHYRFHFATRWLIQVAVWSNAELHNNSQRRPYFIPLPPHFYSLEPPGSSVKCFIFFTRFLFSGAKFAQVVFQPFSPYRSHLVPCCSTCTIFLGVQLTIRLLNRFADKHRCRVISFLSVVTFDWTLWKTLRNKSNRKLNPSFGCAPS